MYLADLQNDTFHNLICCSITGTPLPHLLGEEFVLGCYCYNCIIIIILETIVDNPQKNEVLLMIATYSFDSFNLNIYLFGNSVP